MSRVHAVLFASQMTVDPINREDIIRRIDQETQVQLEAMNQTVAGAKEKVITDLLDMVVEDVKPELHRNLRLG